MEPCKSDLFREINQLNNQTSDTVSSTLEMIQKTLASVKLT